MLKNTMPSLCLLAGVLLGLAACEKKQSTDAEKVNVAGVTQALVDDVDRGSSTANPEIWPKLKSPLPVDAEMEKKISGIIAELSTAAKVAQMIQPEIRAFTVAEMREFGFGSYLNGGGAFPNDNKNASVSEWLALADVLYEASIDESIDGNAIPTMWGTDAVHGHNNVIGATIFPHNIGLGAARNPELLKKIGKATAKEVLVTGIDWIFAPTVAVVRDDRWGRTYEGYSEDPELVKIYASAIVEGIQGSPKNGFLGKGRAIATAKHFVGDGGTERGDDQGENLASEEELRDVHSPGYFSSIESGVQTIMASFNSWHGEKMHGNRSLLTDVLKDRLGFDGLVVGDWDGHSQIKGCTRVSCKQAIIAGVDIIMVPNEWRGLFDNTVKQVDSGEIPMTRIDDAVRRILRVKMRAGLFDAKKPSERAFAGKKELLGSAEHRAIARQAVRESLVLLKNKNSLLPLKRKMNVLVAGDAADNIGKVSGGWTISWQGTGNKNSDFPGATSIYQGINDVVTKAGGSASLSVDGSYKVAPDVAIVVFGENPYAEGEGDISNLQYQREDKRDLALLKGFKKAGIPVVSVFITGRPMWVNKELNASDAFVVAWLPGSEGQGVSDVLFKKEDGAVNFDFTGKLSFSWPKRDNQAIVNRYDNPYDPLFAYDFGLTYKDTDTLTDALSEVAEKVEGISGSAPLDLFRNRSRNGLTLYIGDPGDWAVPVVQSVMTSKGSENLIIKAINWQVQEDARQVTWAGNDLGLVYLAKTEEQLNYYDFLKTKSAMRFNYRVDAYPSSWVEVKIDCGYPCSGNVEISERLKKNTIGEWQSLSIDLNCFEKSGTNFVEVSAPWAIATDGSLSLSFADVEYVPGLSATADIQCSD